MDVVGAVINVDETVLASAGNRRANSPIVILLLIDEHLLEVILVLLELLIMTKHSVM